jgi:hypothetical protein
VSSGGCSQKPVKNEVPGKTALAFTCFSAIFPGSR